MKEVATRENFRRWAQMGYIARGTVYLVIGVLALLYALDMGGATTDSKGALNSLRDLPLGDILLAVVAIGLWGYTLWRFVQAIRDTDSHGTSFKALVVRGSLLISGVVHAMLAVWVVRLLTASSPLVSEGSSNWFVSRAGVWLFGMLGVAVIITGIAHIYKGWTARFERYMALPTDRRHWLKPLCQFGLISRGLVWCALGWILLNSAMVAGTTEIQNTSDALAWLNHVPLGDWLLGIIAIGLVAFGIYSILEALYRRINPSV